MSRVTAFKSPSSARSDKTVAVRGSQETPKLVHTAVVVDTERPESISYDLRTGELVRSVRLQDGKRQVSSAIGVWPRNQKLPADLASAADALWLRLDRPPPQAVADDVRVADLFSGCGAMSLGVAEACRALRRRFVPVGPFDVNETALKVYCDNFGVDEVEPLDLGAVLCRQLGRRPTRAERRLRRRVGRVDLVVAGPPCQGHSDLNNRTRRRDPKNGLYFLVARFAKLCRPRWIIVENVMPVLHDSHGVVKKTLAALVKLGYDVKDGIVDVATLGVAQRRRRHLLVAARARGRGKVGKSLPRVEEIVKLYQSSTRPVSWAIRDIARQAPTEVLDQPAEAIGVTRRRIDYLFEHDLHELPDSQRPACHRDKDHTYNSVYGRMHWASPAPTITCGFVTMGCGRFVHPSRRRTITPHEAARIQFIPDFFDFAAATRESRGHAVELIGNAVPPKLSYIIALELMR